MEIKQELRPYVPLAQMLVQTLGPNCEVVLHDLDTPAHSVVYVENPSVTGRKVGESFDVSRLMHSAPVKFPRAFLIRSDDERICLPFGAVK